MNIKCHVVLVNVYFVCHRNVFTKLVAFAIYNFELY